MAKWPTCTQSGYITPAVLGVPNVQRGEKNRKWPSGPHAGKTGYITSAALGSPTVSAGT